MQESTQRADLYHTFVDEMTDLWAKKHNESSTIRKLLFKKELIRERRVYQNNAAELQERLKTTDCRMRSLESQNSEKSRESKEKISQMLQESAQLRARLENSLLEIENHCSKEALQEQELSSLRTQVSATKKEAFESEKETILRQEAIGRLRLSSVWQEKYLSFQVDINRRTEIFYCEKIARYAISYSEQESRSTLHEEHFSSQKRMFYKKALSLTKCIRSDR